MSIISATEQTEEDLPTVTEFGYELIRETLLTELLGSDAPEILYWAGKRLARKYPLKNFADIGAFFKQADWGILTIEKETRHELEADLYNERISKKLKMKDSGHFQLEAGFLAQQIEMQKNAVAEAFVHPRKKGAKVHFTVKWDIKDSIAR
ncbi:DUF2507 domain-containing protein [Bacillus canaveralius]|uniref:DUF2507 domain-containing protein n=1 Tax=Bacillus canaveralius TaxID=1403243 RepID=A0A2N5GFU3_9BACI|nr:MULTISPECIES: YslB family protein [Bacillus]PLR79595.1 DUF2507 domain-containing protein [Bacillus canaveralius]PLR83087.1 DUF2507 domain-containing protein [Bacillus sp. V33-4]PLR90099.1 DUF2507 domain-containing protein [Bacillus canaveralius]RSK52496.1 DUF2507 domain-containing protein [Bacillus canaveralius]